MRPVPDIAAHIRARLAPPDQKGCELWLGSRSAKGYGVVKHRGKSHKVHHFRYELEVGPLREGEIVRHTCDNPPCAALGHLEPGTHASNAADRKARLRGFIPRGSSNPHHKLTEADVVAIRADTRLQREIAAEFGITQSIVSGIRRRATWKHVP